MENADLILIVSSFVMILIALVGSTIKSGFVIYSPQSLFRSDQTGFEVNHDGIGKFIGGVALSLLANIVYALVITQGDLATALLFSIFNTAVIGYCLAYWVLLKEKRKNEKYSR